MRLILCLFLLFLICLTTISCQGAGGRKSSKSSISRGWKNRPHRGISSCKNGQCLNQEFISTLKLFLIVILILSILFLFNYLKEKRIQTNEDYINSSRNPIEIEDLNLFQSGLWLTNYYQYDRWHGPYQLDILFDSETNKLCGNGSDDVGHYTIEGIYSTKTNRIGLTKKYLIESGDDQENFGHDVTIQISWNSIPNHFEGYWYIQTNNSYTHDKFQLKLEKTSRHIQ